eukprot:418177_1
MDFEDVLSANIIDEWKIHYISYHMLMKTLESRCQSKEENVQAMEGLWLRQAIDEQFNQKMQNLVSAEFKKVNTFYLLIEKQLYNEYKSICFSLNTTKTNTKREPTKCIEKKSNINKPNNDNKYLKPLNIPKSMPLQSKDIYLTQMKKNIFFLYQRFIALSNYSIINRIGFQIIINEANENHNNSIDIMDNNLDFMDSNKCNDCMNGLIKLYAKVYEDGDINKGKVRLFNSISWNNTKLLNNDQSIFTIGTKFGIMLGLIFWTILELLSLFHIDLDAMPKNVQYIYESCGVFTLFLWFWTLLVYIWSNKRINFVFIFQLNPRSRLTFLQYFDIVTTLTNIYLIHIILFIQTFKEFGAYYSIIWPISLFIFYILYLLLPIFDNWYSRKIILKSLLSCIIAPFGTVGFQAYFIADVLTSFSKEFIDIYMSGCILLFHEYSENKYCVGSKFSKMIKPVLVCIPYWWRLMQAINMYYATRKTEKLFCGFKYFLSMVVKVTGSIFGMNSIWFVLSLISTFYLIFWDLKMDWNCFPWNKRLKLYPIWWYYCAIIIDCILRFFWIFTLFPDVSDWPYFTQHSPLKYPLNIISLNIFLVFIEIVEIFRRALWSVFRVEKAHINVQEEFKVYEYVPLFYENNTLIDNAIITDNYNENNSKSNKSKSKIVLLIIIIVIVSIIMLIIDKFDFNDTWEVEFNVYNLKMRVLYGILCLCLILIIILFWICYFCKRNKVYESSVFALASNSNINVTIQQPASPPKVWSDMEQSVKFQI